MLSARAQWCVANDAGDAAGICSADDANDSINAVWRADLSRDDLADLAPEFDRMRRHHGGHASRRRQPQSRRP